MKGMVIKCRNWRGKERKG